ncbi:MAG: hypothetical protein PHF84_07970, partial [bacterium]|nr:hypothetical protein [bacterium]
MKQYERQGNSGNPAGKKINWKGLVFLLLVFLWALYYNQWVTLEKLSNAVNPLSRFGTVGDFFRFLDQYGSRIFDGMDQFVFYLILFIPVLLLIMEYRKKYLSRFIEILPRQDKYIILYLAVLSVYCLRYYLALGQDGYNGDAP